MRTLRRKVSRYGLAREHKHEEEGFQDLVREEGQTTKPAPEVAELAGPRQGERVDEVGGGGPEDRGSCKLIA